MFALELPACEKSPNHLIAEQLYIISQPSDTDRIVPHISPPLNKTIDSSGKAVKSIAIRLQSCTRASQSSLARISQNCSAPCPTSQRTLSAEANTSTAPGLNYKQHPGTRKYLPCLKGPGLTVCAILPVATPSSPHRITSLRSHGDRRRPAYTYKWRGTVADTAS